MEASTLRHVLRWWLADSTANEGSGGGRGIRARSRRARKSEPRRAWITLSPPHAREAREWRRERDSNPRDRFRSNGFQDRRHRPLGHPSAGGLLTLYGCDRPDGTRGPRPSALIQAAA
jgi:hypothetical protein